jgi:hypothetical protein
VAPSAIDSGFGIDNDVVIMDDMNERISTLGKDLSALRTDVAVIRSNYATREDLAVLEASLLKWGFGAFATLTGIIVAAVKFVR